MADGLGLRDGDHACILYSSEEEHADVIGAFLAEGLQGGQRVLNILHTHTPQEMRGILARHGVDAAACEAKGQLTFRDASAYTPDGTFQPDGMVSGLMGIVEDALKGGWDGVRGSGEMSWCLDGKPGSERVMEYEAKLNSTIPGSRFRAICQYDVRMFPPETLLEVLTTHPVAFVGRKRLDNFYFMPPEQYLSAERPRAQLQRWIDNLEQRKRLDEELLERGRQKEALARSQAAAQAKARFLNSVAHELVTPLTPVGLQLRVLAAADRQRPLAAYERQLQVIQRGYDRFEALVRHLVDAVQREWEVPDIREGVGLASLAEGTAARHAAAAQAKGVQLVVDVPKDARVRADAALAGKALDQLILNAVHFTPAGGSVEVGAHREGDSWALRVRDSGIGFDPAHADPFAAFAQLHDPMQVQGGVGLGLYIAKEAIERQGGRIWASSPGPGQGSEFGFRLLADP